VPPKVTYTATEMARELHGSLLALTEWAERHRGTIAASREAYDRQHGRPARSRDQDRARSASGR
jgi:DNA-binding HxlR family transcriptional regulator